MIFSELLTQQLNIQNLSVTDLVRSLSDQGTYIPYSSISSYKNNLATPPYEKALIIIKTVNPNISEDEIKEVLSQTRQALKIRHDNEFSRNVRLRPEVFGNRDAYSLKELFQVRAEQLYEIDEITENPAFENTRADFNRYVEYLIWKDLNSAGLL